MFDESDENNIVRFEERLRQTRKAQQRLLVKREEIRSKLKELSAEEEIITREIEALESSAKENEEIIYNLLKSMRARNKF